MTYNTIRTRNVHILLKSIRLYTVSLIVAISFVTSSVTQLIAPIDTSALGCSEQDREARADFYSKNDIQFVDPCDAGGSCAAGSGSLTGPAPTQLNGGSNAEKVWNYFIGRGLTPVGAAGAMGNIEQESSFDPLIEEGGNGIGFGLIQWSFERRTALEAAAAAAGVSFTRSEANNDPALLFQLNYLWDGEYGEMTWQEPVNAETSVDGDPSVPYSADNTGNGSTLVFHKLVERSGDGTTGKQERIDSAKNFLETYGGGSTTGGGDCSLGEGGLTEEQAKQFMINFGKNTDGFSAAQTAGLWDMCSPGNNGSNCVSFAYFFNNTFTDMDVRTNDGNGEAIVGSIRARGANGGTEPKVFSTFSWDNGGYGHVAIILGIHGDNVIVGHASCTRGGNGISGAGDGTQSGNGSGFISMGPKDEAATYLGYVPTEFAYPDNVKTSDIEKFISTGKV